MISLKTNDDPFSRRESELVVAFMPVPSALSIIETMKMPLKDFALLNLAKKPKLDRREVIEIIQKISDEGVKNTALEFNKYRIGNHE